MNPTGYLVYRGPSLLNGAPIVAVVITKSDNTKTGNIAQSYILADGGERPTEALRSGGDAAVCGDCKHRPAHAATCYVVVRQGATRVWQTLRDGLYPDFTRDVDVIGQVLYGRMLRIGAYGDPAAVPVQVWRDLTHALKSWIGYTHQWRAPLAQSLRDLCMASVDTPAESDLARSMGWRPFRVRLPEEPLLARESVCPASEEGGYKLTCETCGACNGNATGRRGAVSIVLHGNHAARRQMRFLRSRTEEAVAA